MKAPYKTNSPGCPTSRDDNRASFTNSGLAPVAGTTAQANPVGKALLALAQHPVSLELTAGAALFLICGLILFGISLRRA